MQLSLQHHYLDLGEAFSQQIAPVSVREPGLIAFNNALANQLGIPGKATDNELAAIFSGNSVPQDARPIAMAYSGHQFGHFNPQLGDGRAILLGELETPEQIFDIHLKGSGQTAFSRNGDGRAALGPVIREYLLSEAMHQLGVPTTRALAAVTTGEQVAREQLLPGGVITRVAKSFVRVGTFQYFASRGEFGSVQKLADFVITRCYPDMQPADNPYVELLREACHRQARLIAKWMQLGFIHGVMNTDNMAISGETIDYGPCAFIDDYCHDKVFSSIDRNGRYAYNQQPSIGLWNLTRLAECLLPLFSDDKDEAVKIATDCLDTFEPEFQHAWLDGMRNKCGLTDIAGQASADRALLEGLLNIMHDSGADFTLTFTYLSQLNSQPDGQDIAFQERFSDAQAIGTWLQQWRQRLQYETQDDVTRQSRMRSVNPAYIPRNHQVEAAIRAAEDQGDFSVFHSLYNVLQTPFAGSDEHADYQLPPQPDEVVERTFCGT